MANFDQLKQSVAALIRTNGAEEITGQIMQDVLLTIINSISGGYMFGGVAQHSGNVGNPDYNVFYLAGSGAYTGYGGAITIEDGCYGVFRYNGVWTQEVVDIGVRLSGSIAPGETRGVTGDVINTALQTLFDNVMDILDTLTFTYNTPSAQQATKAMLDVIMTPTGGAPHVFATLTLASATVAAAGLMSAEDKQKVDRMLTDFRSLSLTDTTAAVDQATKIVQTLSATLGENPEAVTTFTLLAATASKAGLMSADDKVALDKLVAMLGYYVCDTAAGTAAKTISATGYALTNGGCIRIKMTNGNTANGVTLNINGTGAKNLYYNGEQASSSNSWDAGDVLEVFYDGTQYQCASGGGGKFATGEKVKNVGITNVLDDSHNLIESSAVNAVLNDAINFSEWVIGSLKDNHTYDDVQGRIEACAVIDGRPLIYNVASGYAMSIHEYSEEFHTIDTIIGSSWIKYTTSWIEGNGTFTPSSNTKTIVVILSKTPTSSKLAILPSDASNLEINYQTPFSIDNMRTMLNEHESAIDTLEDAVMIEGNVSTSWYQGTLSNAHIYYSTGDVTPQRIIATVPAQKKLTFTIASGYSISVHEYSAVYSNPTEITNGSSWLNTLGTWNEGTLEYIPTAACKTVVLIMRKGNGSSNILPSEGGNLTGTFISPVKYTVEELQENVDGIHDTLEGVDSGGGVYVPAWYQGTLGDANHDYDSTSSYAPKRIICTVPLTPLLKVTVTSGYWASVHEYSEVYANATEITGGSAWLGNTHPWFDGSMDITPLAATKTFVIVMSKGNKNVNISPSEGVNTTVTTDSIHVEGLIEKVENLAYDDSDSYYWGADMIKRKCRTTQLGTLTYLQAFCKYNGKYYSTDGSNIAEQDESFAVLRNVAISVGHGNSLQLVSNGKAWASGWDDQKMYRVDLATLTVDQTITLPTTGYTTCAVDEDNGWMYIFQRQTNPSTEAQYNFIKYDYVNEQIISTRKIETFAALQAVDYWQGKILMLNGFGTQAAPSGMRIYNTSGDVLVTYDLQVFRAKEPEGIIFTRDKGELLVSDVDKKLYIVS